MTRTQQSRGATPRPATNTLDATETTTANSNGTTSNGLRRYPVVFASSLAPSGDRTRTALVTGQCPYCGGRHLHYSIATEQASGVKRSGCRRGTYWIAVNRAYAKPVAA